MTTLFRRLCLKVHHWLLASCEVARFEGIVIADIRHPDNRTQRFPEVMLAALQLLKATDPCRFARVRRRLAWISFQGMAGRSAEYQHSLRQCWIDFRDPADDADAELLTGWCASTLVHEATHGTINTRGVPYSPELRSRIEELCVKQEQKFIQRLAITHPSLAQQLHREFDASEWEGIWNSTRWEQFRRDIKHLLSS